VTPPPIAQRVEIMMGRTLRGNQERLKRSWYMSTWFHTALSFSSPPSPPLPPTTHVKPISMPVKAPSHPKTPGRKRVCAGRPIGISP
jgi:hypothetical protein